MTTITVQRTAAQDEMLRLAPEIFYSDGENPGGASPAEAAAWCERNRDFVREHGVFPVIKASERAPIENVIGRKDTYIGDGDSYYGVYSFDPKTERFAHTHYGSTYSYGTDDYQRTVEATPEVRAHAARVAARYSAIKRHEDRLNAIAEKACEIVRGREVVVNSPRARTKPRTGEGVVFWVGPDRFARYGGTKVGVEFPDGTKGFYSSHEVEVADVTDHIDYDAINNVDQYAEKEFDYDLQHPDWANALYRQNKEANADG